MQGILACADRGLYLPRTNTLRWSRVRCLLCPEVNASGLCDTCKMLESELSDLRSVREDERRLEALSGTVMCDYEPLEARKRRHG